MKYVALFLALSAPCFGARPVSCTNRDVIGTYALYANGSILVPNTPISGPFMRIGWYTANGNGLVQVSTLALYAGINFGQESYSGTYTVTSDCTIDFHLTVPAPVNGNAEFKGQVALGGGDITFILVDTDNPNAPPITTVVGFSERRSIHSCSAGTLAGAWRMEINGTRNLPPLGTGTAYRQVGRFEPDGKGGLRASFITSDNGTIRSETGAGTYNVYSDCTFDLNYTIGTSAYSIRGSMIDNSNAFLGLNLPGFVQPGVGTITGAVATGKMVREEGRSEPLPSRD